MNHSQIIDGLTQNKHTFRELLEKLPPEMTIFKPSLEKWSILEVVNHLYDEEMDDFRMRVALTLEDATKKWPSIAPKVWAIDRKYAERDYAESLENFLRERDVSIAWLEALENPNWKAAYRHFPKIKEMSAEMILANWLAHDWLHIRQIIHLKYEFLAQHIQPDTLAYAGSW